MLTVIKCFSKLSHLVVTIPHHCHPLYISSLHKSTWTYQARYCKLWTSPWKVVNLSHLSNITFISVSMTETVRLHIKENSFISTTETFI